MTDYPVIPLPHHRTGGSASGGSEVDGLRLGVRVRESPSTLRRLRPVVAASPQALGVSSGCPDFCRLASSRCTVDSLSFRLALRVRTLLRPLPTSRRHLAMVPFRAWGEISPGIRAPTVTAQLPDLRHRPLATGASQSLARPPRAPAPDIRFLFVGSSFRFPLPSHARSPLRSCGSLPVEWPR